MAVSQCERRLTRYVVLAFAFSSVFYALIIASGHVGGGNGGYATGLDWCPAAAARRALGRAHPRHHPRSTY
jgi:uncharacterized protein